MFDLFGEGIVKDTFLNLYGFALRLESTFLTVGSMGK